MYTYVHNHISLLNPLQIGNGVMAATDDTLTFNSSDPQSQTTFSRLAQSLNRWRVLWDGARCDTLPPSWHGAGMYSNALKFWLVTHFLLKKRDVAEVLNRMDVMCKDKLAEFRILVDDAVA